MKNQFFGDERDYFKYGILRALARGTLFRLGVCWMLTPADARGQGGRRDYLSKPDKWRQFDPELFDGLGICFKNGEEPCIRMAAGRGILEDAITCEEELPLSLEERKIWRGRCFEKMASADLVFFDPDTGIRSVTDLRRQDPREYLFLEEIRECYSRGHSVIGFQFARIHFDERLARKRMEQIADATGGAKSMVLMTNQVLFTLAPQPKHEEQLAKAAKELERTWAPRIRLLES